MTDKSVGACYITDGGITAAHPCCAEYQVRVGPSTSAEFNTIKAGLVVRACWRLEDVRFEFDSSFITPSAAEEFKHLARLRKEHPEAPLSIFGHADPVGDDEYNKQLSGRRALAVYGMLIRNTETWENLYSNPLGGDKWGIQTVQLILLDLGYAPGEIDGQKRPDTVEAIRKFQSDHGLPASGGNDRQTRAKLFLAYMDAHCNDPEGNPFKLEKTDFLAKGADAGGKGDYQGCGELNPILTFSKAENDNYSKNQDKTERNTENAPNRRVLVFLFRPGSQVTPSKWPCPRAMEGGYGCQQRLWADASTRRSFQENRREYGKDRDTFACRFYDLHFGYRSPCETVMRIFRIRLYDPFLRPIPYAPYRISGGGATVEGVADGQGWAIAKAKDVPAQALVQWGYPPLEGTDNETAGPPFLPYRLDISLNVSDQQEQEQTEKRLHNLGFYAGKTLTDKVRAFQRAYGLDQTGNKEDIEEDLRKYHDSYNPEPLPASNPRCSEEVE